MFVEDGDNIDWQWTNIDDFSVEITTSDDIVERIDFDSESEDEDLLLYV